MAMLEKRDCTSDETVIPPAEVEAGRYDDAPTPLLTWRMFVLGVLVSMGGLIFGVHPPDKYKNATSNLE